MKKIFILMSIGLLTACAETLEVSGGTDNALTVELETTEVAITTTGFCVRNVFGDTINRAACVLDSARPDVGTYSIEDLLFDRDLVLFPYTNEEGVFLVQ